MNSNCLSEENQSIKALYSVISEYKEVVMTLSALKTATQLLTLGRKLNSFACLVSFSIQLPDIRYPIPHTEKLISLQKLVT